MSRVFFFGEDARFIGFRGTAVRRGRAQAIADYEVMFGSGKIDLTKVRDRTRYLAKSIRNVISQVTIRRNRIDLRKDPMALQRLKEAAEKAKIELSSSSETEINLPYIMPVNGIPKHLVRKISRSKFDQLTEDLVKATIEPCKLALKDAGLQTSDIDEVILVITPSFM